MFIFVFRSQTTTGIWMAHCAGIEPCTLVMDLEGTDGRERGEVPFQNLLFTFMTSYGFMIFDCRFPTCPVIVLIT